MKVARRTLYCTATSVITLLMTVAANAQTSTTHAPDVSSSESDTVSIDEIIVTAQKRSERLVDVPLSITAVTGDQLIKRGISNSEQLTKVVPGFTFQKSSYGTPVFQIRGIGFYDTSVGASPTVSVYVDQVPLPYSSMTRGAALDLERVEVLKGPQGTLFGQNSTGGAINFIAAKPTKSLSSGFNLDVGRFSQVNAQAFVSGPISETLTARVVGRYEYRDAWQKGYAPNDSKFGKSPSDELGQRRFLTGRFLLDWVPNDKVSFELNVNGWQDHSDTQAAQFQAFAPDKPQNIFNGAVFNGFVGTQPLVPLPKNSRVAGWDARNDYARDDYFYQFSLRGDIQLNDSVQLSSITAYSRYHEDSVSDIDGVAYNDFVNTRIADVESFSQELRLSGQTGAFKWMFGGNYASDIPQETQRNLIHSTQANIGPFQFDEVEVRSNQRIKTYAGFASVDYALTDQLTFQASARYTKQDRSFNGCFADPGTDGRFALAFGSAFGAATQPGKCITLAALPPAPAVVLPSVTNSLNEDNVSWRGGLSWKPNRATLLYANVTKGYKAGAFPTIPGGFAFQYSPVTQESVLAYETGFKTSFIDGKVRLNGAAFYYDYRNKQLLGVVPIFPFGFFPRLVNIPKSRVAGAELDMTVTPFSGLTLSAGGTYVSSKVLKDPGAPINAYGTATSYVGESFPNAPRWQGVADAEYRFHVGQTKEVFFGGSLTGRTGAEAVFNGTTAPLPGQTPLRLNGYALLDLRLGIEGDNGKWRAQIWGQNVTNKYYLINKARLADSVSALTGMPATYGISLSYKY